MSNITVSYPSTAAIAAYKAVAIIAGEAVPADKDTSAHATALCGLTTASVAENAVASIQVFGEIDNSAWTFTPGGPVYIGDDGALTQTAPVTGFVRRIGFAETARRMFLGPHGETGEQGEEGDAGADGVFSAIASQAEAEAGSNNTKGMTPLRTAEAIAALAITEQPHIADPTNEATLLTSVASILNALEANGILAAS